MTRSHRFRKNSMGDRVHYARTVYGWVPTGYIIGDSREQFASGWDLMGLDFAVIKRFRTLALAKGAAIAAWNEDQRS